MPTQQWSDVVIQKEAGHRLGSVKWQVGRWKAERESEKVALVEDFDAVVIGAGQAGLCASYELKQRGLKHVRRHNLF